MDGLLPSLRDSIHQIKGLYWVRQMQVFDGAAQEAALTRNLPDAEKLGLFPPADKPQHVFQAK